MDSAWLAIPPLMLAVIVHEVMHGQSALWLGDDTAKRLGLKCSLDGYKVWFKNGKEIHDLPAHYPLKILVEYGVLTHIQIAKERLK